MWPETVVLLRLDPSRGLAREEEVNRISAAGLALQVKVAESYDRLAADEPDRFVVLDAAAGLAAVVEEAEEEVLRRW